MRSAEGGCHSTGRRPPHPHRFDTHAPQQPRRARRRVRLVAAGGAAPVGLAPPFHLMPRHVPRYQWADSVGGEGGGRWRRESRAGTGGTPPTTVPERPTKPCHGHTRRSPAACLHVRRRERGAWRPAPSPSSVPVWAASSPPHPGQQPVSLCSGPPPPLDPRGPINRQGPPPKAGRPGGENGWCQQDRNGVVSRVLLQRPPPGRAAPPRGREWACGADAAARKGGAEQRLRVCGGGGRSRTETAVAAADAGDTARLRSGG